MKWKIVLVMCAGLVLGGCKKEEATSRDVKPLATLDAKQEAPPAPADPTDPAVATEPTEPPPPSGPGDPPQAAETINSALHEYLDNGNPMPKDMEELMRLKLLVNFPKPPPGKRFVLDKGRNKVIVVNQ